MGKFVSFGNSSYHSRDIKSYKIGETKKKVKIRKECTNKFEKLLNLGNNYYYVEEEVAVRALYVYFRNQEFYLNDNGLCVNWLKFIEGECGFDIDEKKKELDNLMV